MKRVLVPLDGTKNGEAALSAMADFCNAGDEVILLKVEKPQPPQRAGFRPSAPVMEAITESGVPLAPPDVPFYVEMGDQAIQRQVDEAKDYLQGLTSNLRDRGLEVDTEVLIADSRMRQSSTSRERCGLLLSPCSDERIRVSRNSSLSALQPA